jgi:CRISPR/Cas system CMR-associated protein Cmr3 (group 5 of RAMP superfamily)
MGLPRLNHPLFTSKNFLRFSDDGFFMSLERRDEKFDREKTRAFLEEIGASNIELIEDEETA